MCGFIAQLVENRTGIAEVTGLNPVEALIFSSFFFPIAYWNWKIYSDGVHWIHWKHNDSDESAEV